MTTCILVVDDDDEIRASLAEALAVDNAEVYRFRFPGQIGGLIMPPSG